MENFKLSLLDKKELVGTASRNSICTNDEYCIVGTTKDLYKITCSRNPNMHRFRQMSKSNFLKRHLKSNSVADHSFDPGNDLHFSEHFGPEPEPVPLWALFRLGGVSPFKEESQCECIVYENHRESSFRWCDLLRWWALNPPFIGLNWVKIYFSRFCIDLAMPWINHLLWCFERKSFLSFALNSGIESVHQCVQKIQPTIVRNSEWFLSFIARKKKYGITAQSHELYHLQRHCVFVLHFGGRLRHCLWKYYSEIAKRGPCGRVGRIGRVYYRLLYQSERVRHGNAGQLL